MPPFGKQILTRQGIVAISHYHHTARTSKLQMFPLDLGETAVWRWKQGVSLALATWNHPYLIAAVKLKEKGSRVAVVFANFRLIAKGNVKNQLLGSASKSIFLQYFSWRMGGCLIYFDIVFPYIKRLNLNLICFENEKIEIVATLRVLTVTVGARCLIEVVSSVPVSGHFPLNFHCETSMRISTAQARTKHWPWRYPWLFSV